VDAQIETARYEEFSVLATRLGVPVEYFVNPEALAANRATATEILTKLLDPANRSLLQREPALLSNLLAATGVSSLAQPAGSTPVPSVVSVPQPAAIGIPQVVTSTATHLDEPTGLDLNVDRRIARLLARHSDGFDDVIGVSGSGNGDTATVLVVCEQQPLPVPVAVLGPIASVLGAQHASVFSFIASSYQELIEEWLDKAVGEQARRVRSTCSVEATSGLETMDIVIRGEPRAARAVVAQLKDVDRTELAALEALLPFAGVALRMG
jgi:hypothetical protein